MDHIIFLRPETQYMVIDIEGKLNFPSSKLFHSKL